MEHGVDIGAFLLAFAAALLGAKLFGEIAERLGQPAVLGELLAGVVLGPSVLGLVPLSDGIFLLVGDRRHPSALRGGAGDGPRGAPARRRARRGGGPRRHGAARSAAATCSARALGHPTMTAIFVGAAMTATSIGITARVLSELEVLKTPGGPDHSGRRGRRRHPWPGGAGRRQRARARAARSQRPARAGDGARDRVPRRGDPGRDAARKAAGARRREVARSRDARARRVGRVRDASWPWAAEKAGVGADRRSLRRGAGAGAHQPPARHRRSASEAGRGHLRAGVLRFGGRAGGRRASQSLRCAGNRPALLLALGLDASSASSGSSLAGFCAWGKVRRAFIGAGMVPRGEVGLIFASIGRRRQGAARTRSSWRSAGRFRHDVPGAAPAQSRSAETA